MRRLRVETTYGIIVDGAVDVLRELVGGRSGDGPNGDYMAPDADPELRQHRLGNRTARDPGCGLPGAGTLQDVPRVAAVVLEDAHEVRVSGPRKIVWPQSLGVGLGPRRDGAHRRRPVLPIAIPNEHGDRRAQGLAQPHARDHVGAVGLDLHATAAAVATLSAAQLGVDVTLHVQRQPRRHPFEEGDQPAAVGLAGGSEREPTHYGCVLPWE